MDNQVILKLAEYLHNNFKSEKEKEGFHVPQKCPNFERQYEEDHETMDADFIHCNKCNINMCDFINLENFEKDKYIAGAQKMYDAFMKLGIKMEV